MTAVEAFRERQRAGDAAGAAERYEALPDISIDFAVMEKASEVRAVPLRAGWSDVGHLAVGARDAEALRRERQPDPVRRPGARARSPRQRDRRVSPNGVLVLPFEQERELRAAVERLRRGEKGRPEPGRHGAGAARPAIIPAARGEGCGDDRDRRPPDLDRLRENIQLAYRGPRRAVDLVLTALFSRGHVLIEDVPGVGKTTLARALGRSLALEFRRIQFTSDTLPADVLGISVFQSSSERFEFHAGPIFANVVLADEINRATPKTQSALLEAMNEGAVTVDSERRPLPQPFLVVATQNPIEYLGTYPLPESQMDRFFLRLSLGYPDPEEEKKLLRRGGTERALLAIPPVLSPERGAARCRTPSSR